MFSIIQSFAYTFSNTRLCEAERTMIYTHVPTKRSSSIRSSSYTKQSACSHGVSLQTIPKVKSTRTHSTFLYIRLIYMFVNLILRHSYMQFIYVHTSCQHILICILYTICMYMYINKSEKQTERRKQNNKKKTDKKITTQMNKTKI